MEAGERECRRSRSSARCSGAPRAGRRACGRARGRPARASARAGCPRRARPRRPASRTSVELGRVETGVGRGGRDQRRVVEQAAGHHAARAAAAAAPPRPRARSAARPRPRGRPAPTTRPRVRRRVDRHAVRAAGRARPAASFSASPGSSVRTIIVSRQRQLVAVVPAQPPPDRLGRERERTRRVGEELDLHHSRQPEPELAQQVGELALLVGAERGEQAPLVGQVRRGRGVDRRAALVGERDQRRRAGPAGRARARSGPPARAGPGAWSCRWR